MNLDNERNLFEQFIEQKYGESDSIEWFNGNPIKGIHLMLWDAWLASAKREGYKLVPIEPDQQMIYAGESAEHKGCISVAVVYKAMLGAVNET